MSCPYHDFCKIGGVSMGKRREREWHYVEMVPHIEAILEEMVGAPQDDTGMLDQEHSLMVAASVLIGQAASLEAKASDHAAAVSRVREWRAKRRAASAEALSIKAAFEKASSVGMA